jgi:hypothetical protein
MSNASLKEQLQALSLGPSTDAPAVKQENHPKKTESA